MRCPMITGHTGNDGTPANSVASIEKSISLGADAFEVDIRKDRNSVLVLSHDEQKQRTFDTCSRLSDAFEMAAIHPSIRINCDLKDDDLPLEVIALARDYGIGADRLILSGTVTPSYLSCHPEISKMAAIYLNAEYILEDFYFNKFTWVKAKITYDTFHYNPWKSIKGIFPCLDTYIGILSDTCLKYGVKGINIPYVFLTDENIRRFTKYGVAMSAWTVNDEAEMARLFSSGIENITTCRVGKARSVRENLLGF